MKQTHLVMGNIIGRVVALIVSPFFNGTGIKTTYFDGYRKISDVFPDTYFATIVADILRKKQSDSILCDELFLIRKLHLDGSEKEINDFSGLEYLANLEVLRLHSYNTLREIPVEIKALTQLKTLGFAFGSIQDIPEWIYTLPKLTKLIVSHQELVEISPKISSAKRLKHLCLADNEIKLLPKEIAELSSLEVLKISDNPLEALPVEYMYFKKIKKIDVSNTEITSIPISLAFLDSLKELNIKGTKVQEIDNLFYQATSDQFRLYVDTDTKMKVHLKEKVKEPKGMFPGGLLLTSVSLIGTVGLGVLLSKDKIEKRKKKN